MNFLKRKIIGLCQYVSQKEMLQGAKIRNLGAAIWRAILNIKYYFLLTKVCV